ncbi:MAG: lipopolysaccharide heptosyltransferase II [Verrucomicrobiota bacterium]|nr:lipopolysaccharide heptosyltransferase II [Verrucomicrobiota bacterium]
MLDFCVYLLYRAALAVVSAIPLRALNGVGETLGLLHWFLLGKYRRLARHNLEIAFGSEKSEAELRRLTRKHFQRLGANLLCSMKVGAMPLEKVAECVAIENGEVIHTELRAGKPVVLVLSHMGSWEIFPQVFMKHFGYAPIGTVYQSLGNRHIDADVQQKRARAGVKLFDRKEGFQKTIAHLRRGGLVGILSDQHAGDQGLWTPFFGRLASTTPLGGLLAKRTNAAVVAAAVLTDGPGKWRMVFTPRFDSLGDSVESITFKANNVIADQIRRAPEDWFWVHNRWKTPKPNFLLREYKRGVHVPDDIPLKPFRILIRGTNWLGDSVISTAAVRAIKRGRPDAHVTVATPANLAPVWKLVSEVDDVVPLPNKSLFVVSALLKKQTPFDVAILFPNSLRSALEVWLAAIPRRVGYRGHSRSWFLNQIVPEPDARGPIKHQVHRYLHLAKEIGASVEPEPIRGLLRPNKSSKIGLCPGAEYGPAKRWLPERFAEVAAAIDGQWILFGTDKDAEIGKTIENSLGEKCVNRIGKTTLEELISELRECRLLLTNDTGTMHLATLLGVPVVAVFGSTEDRLTGPLGADNVVMRHHVECSPCFLRECPIDFRCMKSVTSEEVVAAIREKI